MLNLMTKAGYVSAYGLACGYIEQAMFSDVRLRLWYEHGCYHVRAHDFAEHGRLFWDSFSTVKAARKRFRIAANMIQLTQVLKGN